MSINDKVPERQEQSSEKGGFAVHCSRSDNHLLGTTTGFASASNPNPNEINASAVAKTAKNNTRKYQLQALALENRPNSRLGICMKTQTEESVHLHYNDEDQHAHYRGLMRCDKYWECPVCSSRYTSRQAEDVREAYSYAVDTMGWHVGLVTYTMSHKRMDKLVENIAKMRESRRSMRSGGWWQRFKSDYGYEGCISAMEVTYGSKSGWHVHIHELMFLSSDYVKEYESESEMRQLETILDDRLSLRWAHVVDKHGRKASLEHGIDVKLQDKYVAEYVAKEGHLPESLTWDTALELTKAMNKTSSGGLHPFQILELSGDKRLPYDKRKQMKALWIEYVTAFDGKAMFFWSNGLKDALLVAEVIEGEEETKESDAIINIPEFIWSDVVRMKQRAELLNQCISVRGDPLMVNMFLNKIHLEATKRRKKGSVNYAGNKAKENMAKRGSMSNKAKLLKQLQEQGYGKPN